jgi:hypothetical protein
MSKLTVAASCKPNLPGKVRARTSAWYKLYVEATSGNMILPDLYSSTRLIYCRIGHRSWASGTLQYACTISITVLQNPEAIRAGDVTSRKRTNVTDLHIIYLPKTFLHFENNVTRTGGARPHVALPLFLE